MQDLLTSFKQALASADQTISNDLLSLALDLAKQMIREALRIKPELVFAVVRECIRAESAFSQPPQLCLHPEDAALVREYLGQELDGWHRLCRSAAGAWRLQDQDCNGQTDATLATRWKRIGQALGQNGAWLE